MFQYRYYYAYLLKFRSASATFNSPFIITEKNKKSVKFEPLKYLSDCGVMQSLTVLLQQCLIILVNTQISRFSCCRTFTELTYTK